MPANGGPIFPRSFLVVSVFYFIKILKLALPGVMLKYEQVLDSIPSDNYSQLGLIYNQPTSHKSKFNCHLLL